MNTLVKSAVAGALVLGATSAFAMGQPTTGSSDLILFVDALTSTGSSAGVYALDTGISLNQLLPGPYVAGAANDTSQPLISKVIGPSATLAGFLSSHSSNTIEWTLEGGQFSGTGSGAFNSNTVAPGAALAVFTSPALTGAFPTPSSASTGNLQSFLNGLQGDLSAAGAISGLNTATETGTASESSAQAQAKYGFLNGADLASTGSTSIKLFGFTGNGIAGGTLQSYLLGNASLGTDGTLSINPPSAVPLPAAVWLFGSGLMGLVGVSRRRKAAAAA